MLADIDADGDVLPLDVTDGEACEQVVATVLERHGRLDAVWANAGIASFGPLALTDPVAGSARSRSTSSARSRPSARRSRR